LTPIRNIIRGGTDGARLCLQAADPNLFTGANFHSRQEWISVQDMQKAVDVIVKLVQAWVKKSPDPSACLIFQLRGSAPQFIDRRHTLARFCTSSPHFRG
jgi:hypothetical protein